MPQSIHHRPGPRHVARAVASGSAVLLAIAALVGGVDRAVAHPHVWIEVKATVMYERGTFTALRQTWIFDELYTVQALDGLPAAVDGSYGRQELAELAKANMEGLKEFGYFTHVSLGGQPLKLADPTEAYLEHVAKPKADVAETTPAAPASESPPGPAAGFWTRVWDSLMGRSPAMPAVKSAAAAAAARPEKKVLALTFTVPFEQPILADVPDLEITVADPSIFIWLEPAKTGALGLAGEAPTSCVVRFKPVEGAADDQKRLGDAFSTAMGGGSVIQMGGPRTIQARC